MTMAIYVDPIRRYGHVKGQAQRHGVQWCHMATDCNVAELHAMADRIGLSRRYFQPHNTMPHYDLVPTMRTVAIRCGAIEVSSMEMVVRCSKVCRELVSEMEDRRREGI